MSILAVILFIIIIAILVFVHELGHFVVAKWRGIRVDEFAIGFPPRIFSFKYGETVYAINCIPFGGYVKIFGENPDEESLTGPDSSRSMVNKGKITQTAVLLAGVTFNVLFAWLLISFSFMSGMPTSAGFASAYFANGTASSSVINTRVIVTGLVKDSPAEKSEIKVGNVINSISIAKSTGSTTATVASAAPVSATTSLSGDSLTVSSIQDFIQNSSGKPIAFDIASKTSSNDHKIIVITPAAGLVSGKAYGIGIGMDTVGIIKISPLKAFYYGAITTGIILKETAVGLFNFIIQTFIGKSHLSEVSGPVGIIGMVGQASEYGWAYLVSFTAFISINLAVINVLPFPALDGGRILFIIIETIKGSKLSPKIANTANAIGFALLLALMLAVTFHDVVKLFT